MNNQNFFKEMTGNPVSTGGPTNDIALEEGIALNTREFQDPEEYVDYVPGINTSRTAPGEVSPQAIAALLGGAKPKDVKALNNKAIMESTTDLPKEALKNLLGGNTQAARVQATKNNVSEHVRTSNMLSVDDPMQYVTNTKNILEERIKAKAAAKGFINEAPIQKTTNESGISQEELDKIVEDKVMTILQNMADLKGKERNNSEILMVIGDKIFKGNLKMIGKINK